MPRHPALATDAQRIRGMTFAAFGQRMAELRARGELIPLHLGDVAWLPPAAARALDPDELALHQYGPVAGLPALREGVARRLRERFSIAAESDDVLITAGSTGGLTAVTLGLLDPGDEVIVITPSWPLIFGILQGRGITPIEVDIAAGGWPERDPAAFRAALDAAVNERTAAIYFCDPNNPAGFVYPRAHLGAIAEVAARHELWVICDAVYQDLILADVDYTPAASMPALAGRTVTVGSFSKSLGLAGHRVGFVAGREVMRPLLPRLNTHTIYHPSVAGQRMALAALGEIDAFLAEVSRIVARGAEITRESLRATFRPAQAGTFAFVDLRPQGVSDLDGLLAFLGRCLDRGVALAPGAVFGERFVPFARLAFAATEEDVLREGIARVNEVVAAT